MEHNQKENGRQPSSSPYSPLKSARSFRLLHLQSNGEDGPIECKIITYDLIDGEFPPYTALSYTWGALDKALPVLIGDNECHITSDLFEAMKAIREIQKYQDDMSGYWWIDMLCINQDDMSERSQQVGLMRDIFQKATGVVAWLGPDYLDSSLVMQDDGTESIGSTPKTERLDDQGHRDKQLLYRSFLTRPYWSRLWIIQELCAAKRILLACGKRTLPWEEFQAQARGHRIPNHPLQLQIVLSVDNFQVLIPYNLMELRAKLQSSKSKMSLGSLLTFSAQSLSTDPRDRIFGLLGLATGDSIDGIVPDYTMSPCRVFCAAIRAILQRLSSRHVTAIEKTRMNASVKKCLHNPLSKDDGSRDYCEGMDCNVWWCCLELALFDS